MKFFYRSACVFAGALLFLALFSACAHAPAPLESGLGSLFRPQPGISARASSSDRNWQDGNADARPIPPGETLVLAELQGPGIIRHIWNTIASQESGYSRLLALRMYWDGEAEPSVECPLGDFFGVGHGLDLEVNSLPVRVTSEGRARNCYWPMPFRKSARITVTNEGRMPVRPIYWYVDWQKVPDLPTDTPYFHAMYRQEHPAVMGRNYLLADIEGRGHYVGTLLSVRLHSQGWWGEGDDFFYVDGEEEPSIRGTGSEDYLCDAWGIRQQDGPFYGAPLVEHLFPYDRASCYRWHVADPVVFQKSLRAEIEHKGVLLDPATGNRRYGERPDDFSSVAYWYQLEPHKPFEKMPVGYARLYYDPAGAMIAEAETLVEEAQATSGTPSVQKAPRASGGAHLLWAPPAAEQTLAFRFPIAQPATYQLFLDLPHGEDYGVFQLEVDGRPLGRPLDLQAGQILFREYAFPPVELAEGEHVLTIRNLGARFGERGVVFGLDRIILVKSRKGA